jgi:four helix bundle protein
MMQENVILKKTIEFSLSVIRYVELLESGRKFVIANQLMKSGTSIGANVHEAQNAESKQILYTSLKLLQKK